jgi:hypothetical protein
MKPTPPPLPPNDSNQDRVKAWIIAASVTLALLAIFLAIALLAPKGDGSGLGVGAATEGVLDDADAGGEAKSERAAYSNRGKGENAYKADSPESGKSAAGGSDIGREEHDLVGDKSVPNEANGTLSTLESAETLTAKGRVEGASEQTTRSFFTLDSKGNSAAQEVDEQAAKVPRDIRDLLTGRRLESKGKLLREGGGTSTTEGAVKLGLEWLARNQQSNGLWSLRGPYADGGRDENVAAATAMALLAFQGAGHTHKGDPKDPYTAVVARGSKALVEHIRNEGESYRNAGLHGGYTQALCTIALCELYGMTGDAKLRKPVENAVNYCVEAQSREGGWRYTPRGDSDTSVTGWFVLALQSARMAGIKVPNKTLGGVTAYLDSAGNDDGSRYGYQQGTAATRSMTAEALLCRQYLGWNREDRRLLNGADYLLDELPSWQTPNVYYWYYATQLFHHLGGTRWKRWNEKVREILPSEQIIDGLNRGSWTPRGDIHAQAGGRLYVTCMCLYMLEVYYRHLPMYQESITTD